MGLATDTAPALRRAAETSSYDLPARAIAGLAIALLALAGCAKNDDTPGGMAGAGVGGSLPPPGVAGVPAGGAGGMTAPQAGVSGGTVPAGGAGGAPPVGGAAGMTIAGAGGMAGGGAGMAAGGSGGMAGGAAGAAGSGTEMPGPGEVTSAQCIADLMAAGTTVGTCEMCLCGIGKCQKELMALKGDANGNALVKCSQEKKCSGQCCVCGATCDPLGANYGMGPCFDEIEAAAGVAPGSGLAGAADVMTNCATTGPDTNSCARAVRLAECSAMKCMAECMSPTCM